MKTSNNQPHHALFLGRHGVEYRNRQLLTICLMTFAGMGLVSGFALTILDPVHPSGPAMLANASIALLLFLGVQSLSLRNALIICATVQLACLTATATFAFPPSLGIVIYVMICALQIALFHEVINWRLRWGMITLTLVACVGSMVSPFAAADLAGPPVVSGFASVLTAALALIGGATIVEGYIRQSQRMREALLSESSRDPLSKALNRRALSEQGDMLVQRIVERDTSLGVILGDIDHFKSINDTHGHATGDEVIRELSRRLQRAIPNGALLARYGGEEFVVMYEVVDARALRELAESLRNVVSDHAVLINDHALDVTMSFGAVAFPAGLLADNDLDRCIEDADTALYAAKQRGRNRVHSRTVHLSSQRA